MKGRPVDQLVYESMFPRPKTNDPSNFHALLQRNLIPEVRQETHAFYGHLDTQEAKYPGLDYTHKTHRIRLSRWPWHRRLFRAFDRLSLTHFEIAGLTKWEGTKWAKDKFEREQGITIKDTTDDGFPNAADLPDWQPHPTKTRPAVEISLDSDENKDENKDEKDDDDMYVESEDELESVGVSLNERLRAQAARREAGDTHAVLDEEWEQWLKNALESGELSFVTDYFHNHEENAFAFIPARLIEAAQAGQWNDIPEFLHPVLRRTPRAENDSRRSTRARPVGNTSHPESPNSAHRRHFHIDDRDRVRGALEEALLRRSYSDIFLPVGDSGSAHRAETSGAS